MATPQENLAKFQEIANRGIQDQLPPEIRVRFDEAVNRGLVTSVTAQGEAPEVDPLEQRRQIFQQEQRPSVTGIGRFPVAGEQIQPLTAEERAFFQEEQARVGRPVQAVIEPTATVATAIPAEIVSGIGGILAAPFVGGERAGQTVRDIQEALTFQPRTEAGKAGLETVGKVLEPVAKAAEAVKRVTADPVAERLGPGAGATVATIPAAILEAFGLGLIRKFNRASKAERAVNPDGTPTPELQEALKESGQTQQDIAQQAEEFIARQSPGQDPGDVTRKAFLESQGLVDEAAPTTAQVSRTAEDFQAQQEAAKTSGRVRERLETQEAILTSRFDNAVLETGGEAVTPTSPVIDAITSKATVLDNRISELYQQAREIAPEAKNIKLNALGGRLRQLMPSDRATGGAIRSIVGDLQSRGVMDNKFKIVGKIDVETAEQVRKGMNELFDPQNGFRNGKLRALKDALDDDVFRAAGEDTFKEARKAKAEFERDLSRAKISKFDSRKKNLVRDILENKIDQDRFSDVVVFGKSWRAEDLQQLKSYIQTTEGGVQAFDDLRADVLSKIKEKSFVGPEDASGNRTLSRDKLEKAINSIGQNKLGVLFNGKERKFLDDMVKVARLREPVRGTALGRGPSAQAVASLEKRLKEVPVLGALLELVDFDIQGRAVIKGKPRKATPEGTEQ